MSTLSILLRTWPFVLMRLVAHVLFGVVAVVLLGIMGGIGYLSTLLFKQAGAVVFFVCLLAIGFLWGLRKLAERYVLYLIKAGHVAVITELLLRGSVPAGMSQVAYGKDKVVKHFGNVSVLAGVDALVEGSVRQILRWLVRLGSLVTFVPGAKFLWSLVQRVLTVAANYIDEAVFSYILTREGQNVWRVAADGVVLYAQSWKKILHTAILVVFIVEAGWLAVFLLTLFPLLGLATVLAKAGHFRVLFGFIALLVAYLLANVAKWVLVDPVATTAMVVAYHNAIQQAVPSADLYTNLVGISKRFRELDQKAREVPAGGEAAA
jgi:hypothetical protein